MPGPVPGPYRPGSEALVGKTQTLTCHTELRGRAAGGADVVDTKPGAKTREGRGCRFSWDSQGRPLSRGLDSVRRVPGRGNSQRKVRARTAQGVPGTCPGHRGCTARAQRGGGEGGGNTGPRSGRSPEAWQPHLVLILSPQGAVRAEGRAGASSVSGPAGYAEPRPWGPGKEQGQVTASAWLTSPPGPLCPSAPRVAKALLCQQQP